MVSVRTQLAAVTAVVLWSTNAYAADLALGQMRVDWLLLVQYGTAATVLLLVSAVHRLRRGGGMVRRRTEGVDRPGAGARCAVPLLIGVVGLTGTIFLQYLAFALAPIVAANVLAYGWPLLAAVWIAATRRSRHALLSAGLAVIGFCGVVVIFTDSTAAAATVGGAATWGYLAALGSATCMAVFTLGAGRVRTDAVGLLIPATLAGTAAAAALTIMGRSPAPTGAGVLAAAYIGLGPMAAGYALWTRAMARGSAERLSPLGYLTPLLSTVLLLATGSPITAAILTGGGLVLACSLGVLVHTRFTTDRPATRAADQPRTEPTSAPARTRMDHDMIDNCRRHAFHRQERS